MNKRAYLQGYMQKEAWDVTAPKWTGKASPDITRLPNVRDATLEDRNQYLNYYRNRTQVKPLPRNITTSDMPKHSKSNISGIPAASLSESPAKGRFQQVNVVPKGMTMDYYYDTVVPALSIIYPQSDYTENVLPYRVYLDAVHSNSIRSDDDVVYEDLVNDIIVFGDGSAIYGNSHRSHGENQGKETLISFNDPDYLRKQVADGIIGRAMDAAFTKEDIYRDRLAQIQGLSLLSKEDLNDSLMQRYPDRPDLREILFNRLYQNIPFTDINFDTLRNQHKDNYIQRGLSKDPSVTQEQLLNYYQEDYGDRHALTSAQLAKRNEFMQSILTEQYIRRLGDTGTPSEKAFARQFLLRNSIKNVHAFLADIGDVTPPSQTASYMRYHFKDYTPQELRQNLSPEMYKYYKDLVSWEIDDKIRRYEAMSDGYGEDVPLHDFNENILDLVDGK